MSFTVKMSIHVKETDPIIREVRRLIAEGEKPSIALRRIISRYTDIMTETSPSPHMVVNDLAEILSRRLDLVGEMHYPDRDYLITVIEGSAIDAQRRKRLVDYISSVTYAEYAKLIEGTELLCRSK